MLAYTYKEKGRFELVNKPRPKLIGDEDAIVRVTLGSICSSDVHIKHGAVPRAVPGITVGHEMVGVVEEIGPSVKQVKIGDVLATGYWACDISEITEEDSVLIIGGGPTGICTLLCVMLKHPKQIFISEVNPERIRFLENHYPEVTVLDGKKIDVVQYVKEHCEHGGADRVLEVAGSEQTFRVAWEAARPNAIVTIVAMYEKSQELPLPQMYGKNLIFKTGGVDGCHCAETLQLIKEGKLDTTPLITHTYALADIEEAYQVFENQEDGVIKVAIE